MKNIQEFIKNPMAYIAFALISCVAYLFFDNKSLHNKVEQIYREHLQQGEDQKNTMVKVIERNTYIISKLEEKMTFNEKK